MVRFSDLLGGNGDADDSRAPAASLPPRPQPEAPPADEATEPDGPEVELPARGDHDFLAAFAIDETTPAPVETAQDVLDRLTQYATSARSGDQVPDVPEVPPAPAATDAAADADEPLEAFTPGTDDLLPRAGRAAKPGRGRKRRG